jgi:hypothetical protein
MSRTSHIVVSRGYNPAPDACVRALDTLLKSSVIKKATEPTPEPDSRDDAKEFNGCIAYPNHNS